MAARVCIVMFLTAVLTAQNDAGVKEPNLPVIDYNACPFEGCTFGKWTALKPTTIYSAWEEPRTEVGKLKAGQEVTGITGVHVTLQPDRIRIKSAIADLGLAPGDVILRYMYHGEGFADIWAKGEWHKEYDCTFIREKDGSGCARDCAAEVIEDGKKEWWVTIKIADGTTGWVLVEDNFDGMDALASVTLPGQNNIDLFRR